MRRRIAVLAFAAAAIWGGAFLAINRHEDWPEW